jgi:hypothetical protein
MAGTCRRGNAAVITIAVLVAVIVVLAYLWIHQMQTSPAIVERVTERVIEKPVEVVKEVQVEKVREVPREVVVTKEVEVPARLTETQLMAMDLASRFAAAPLISSGDDVFYKLDGVRVTVYADDAVRKALTEDRIHNRFELILRQYGVNIDERSEVVLAISVSGIWDPQETSLTWNTAVELQQVVTIERKSDLRRANAVLWREAGSGEARRRGAEPTIMHDLDAKAESFANRYLAAQAKGT